MDLDKAINARHSAQSFKSTKGVDYRDVLKAIDAATKAPIAGNLPALKYVLVSNPDTIKGLAEAAQQHFISQAKYVVVVCSDKKFLKRSYYKRAEVYSLQQVGAAIENFLIKIVDLGLASCWIGAFDEATVRHLVRVPDEVDIEAMLPVGYELRKGKQKKKPNIDSTVFFEAYKKKHMEPKRYPET